MKLHPSVVQKLLYLCTNYGGHKDEKKLVSHVEALRLSAFMHNEDLSLVDTQQLVTERRSRNLTTADVVPMRLHNSVIQHLMYKYSMYSGHTNEVKLRTAFVDLDFTPYEKKTGNQEVVLVITSDYMKVLQGIQ